jgi:hypothetical protein
MILLQPSTERIICCETEKEKGERKSEGRLSLSGERTHSVTKGGVLFDFPPAPLLKLPPSLQKQQSLVVGPQHKITRNCKCNFVKHEKCILFPCFFVT